jgi:glyoxylate reductase
LTAAAAGPGSDLRKRVLVLADLPGEGIRRLELSCDVVTLTEGLATEEEIAEALAGIHGLLTLLTHRVGEIALAAADELEIVANCAVGVDNIDLPAARRHGVIVTNTPAVLTDDTADLTWALVLSLLRGVVSGDALVRRGEFVGWRPKLLLGRSLQGVTLGVVGAGRIGGAVLRRARAFGVRTLYTSRTRLSPSREAELGAEWRSTLEALLGESDVVSVHVPLNEETHHLLDAHALAAMRPGAYLINTSRGQVVDEEALVRELRSGRLGGAGLDVFEREPAVHPGLIDLDNVVLLPHIGSATLETRSRMADCCCEDLETVLVRGERPARSLTS